MEVFKTHTGKIYCDREKKLEFLTVGDYGKENNIKANFLGFTKEIYGVQNKEVDLKDKWVATISTQHGCPMKCQFCDVWKYGFHGNVSREDLAHQIRTIILGENTHYTKRFNVHYARMGEPTFNRNVLDFTVYDLDKLVLNSELIAGTIHPVISTMLPSNNNNLVRFIQDWCFIKNNIRNGEAGLQFSINSTSDSQRNEQFAGRSYGLIEIALIADSLPTPKGRKYTLNFAVTKDTVLNAKELTSMFDKNKFIVKITPIHETKSAVENGFDVGDSYTDYNVYRKFEEPLLECGWDVIVFVPSVEEDSDRITCGNALISQGV